jgi:hypothetical protein
MKFKLLLLILLFTVTAPILSVDAQEDGVANIAKLEKAMESDSFFDDLEQQAIKVNSFATVEHKPPHILLVWMRVVGSPIVGAYFTVSQKIQASWHWFINQFKKKEVKACEVR